MRRRRTRPGRPGPIPIPIGAGADPGAPAMWPSVSEHRFYVACYNLNSGRPDDGHKLRTSAGCWLC